MVHRISREKFIIDEAQRVPALTIPVKKLIDEKKLITVIEIKSSKKISGRDLQNIKHFKIETNKQIRKVVFYQGSEFYMESNIMIIPVWYFFRAKWE